MPALAGLVPCADSGIRQMSRCAFAAAGMPAADGQQPGVLALAAGVGLQADAGIAGGLAQPGAQLVVQLPVAGQLLARCKGCTWANSGQVIGIISLVALSFIVQLPSGIMLRSSARSLSLRLRM